MLSCDQFLCEFGNYLEGDSAIELRRELEAHLTECRSCRVIVDSTGKTLRIVTETGNFEFEQPLPESFVQKIMRKVKVSGAEDPGGKTGS